MKPDDFIALIGPTAQASAATTTIPASFTIAEAALESGWGESLLAKQGCNLFGVKADASWTGDTLTMPTREVVNGVSVTMGAKWRKYATWQDSIDDHAQFFLKNERYKNALVCVNDSEAFARAIAADHYATDPAYADKIIATMRSHNMTSLDALPLDHTTAINAIKEPIMVDDAAAQTVAIPAEPPTTRGQVLTNHAAVSVSVVVGTIIHTVIQILKAKCGLDLADQEPQILISVMAIAGYVTKRPA